MALGLGLHKKSDEYDKEHIREILDNYGIDNIRSCLDDEEALEVDDDLRSLGFLE